MRDLKRLLGYLGPYRRDMIAGGVLIIAETCFELFIPMLMADLIDVGVTNRDIPVSYTHLLLSFFGYRQMGAEKEERYGLLVAQGQAAGESGDYEQALLLYDEAIQLFSTKLPAYYEKLLAYVEQGEYEACVQYGRLILTNPGLEEAMEREPEAASGIYFMIGNAWFEQERYLDAVEYYKEAVSRYTENPEYYRDSVSYTHLDVYKRQPLCGMPSTARASAIL